MMHTSQSAIPSTASPSRPPPPSQTNPMDPQPFFISQPDPPPQRRTWGQPQPISFAHQGPSGGVEWPPQQPQRRAQWGAPQRPPMMYDPYSGAPIYTTPPSTNTTPRTTPFRLHDSSTPKTGL